jgi:predicted AAA+ superfamily ATPase
VVSELIKQRFNAGQPADLYFWRDSAGNEIDIVFETVAGLQAVEIKSGSTFTGDWVDGLRKWQKFAGSTSTLKPLLVYGGTDSHEREHCVLTGWRDIARD